MIASMTLSCDTSYGCDLLNRMLGRAGCSSCEAPKAPSCGCGGGLMDKLIGKSAGGGCCGSDMLTYDANASCGPVASDCGCGAAPAPVADPVEAAPVVADCGCGAPVAAAPVVADCGCGSPAPVSDCGCSAAPVEAAPVVADCGCSAACRSCSCGSRLWMRCSCCPSNWRRT